MTKTEEDIIDIVKVVSVEGHKETESTVHFDFGDEEEQQILITEEGSYTNNEEEVREYFEKPNTAKEPIPKKKKSSTLRHTIDAVNNFKTGMDMKISIKQKYYNEKLELLKQIATTKERKATASERQADAEERTASASERIASALEAIVESIL